MSKLTGTFQYNYTRISEKGDDDESDYFTKYAVGCIPGDRLIIGCDLEMYCNLPLYWDAT